MTFKEVNMDRELITMKELCQIYKLSRATINRWRDEGLPTIKVGKNVRFDKSKAIEWIERNKVKKD